MRAYSDNRARLATIASIERNQKRVDGFSNKTMRRAAQTKPHIAKIGGFWRVTPWKSGTGSLYYQAHVWAARMNAYAGVANGTSPRTPT